MKARGWTWAAAALGALAAAAVEAGTVPEALTFGVFADPQHGEREAAGSRFYRDSPAKLAECIQAFARAKPAFVICLGDMVDGTSRDRDTEMRHLKTIEDLFRRFDGPRYHVLGNHDLDAFTKDEFLKATGMPAPHYAFDAAPFRCIVLDACYAKGFVPYARGNFAWTDSWVPPDQLTWLEAELKKAGGKALVFTHQPLDGADVHSPRNAADVRRILEDSGKVLAVFSGHNHKGGFRKVRGIPYFTICGMVEGPGVENNAYALVTVSPAGGIRIQGFGAQPSSTRE